MDTTGHAILFGCRNPKSRGTAEMLTGIHYAASGEKDNAPLIRRILQIGKWPYFRLCQLAEKSKQDGLLCDEVNQLTETLLKKAYPHK